MATTRPPISLPAYISTGVVSQVIETDESGKVYIRLSQVLFISTWLYEVGSILGRFWKDRLHVVMEMLAEIGKRDDFTQYWVGAAKKRLEMYGSQPESFTLFVTETDLQMYEGKGLRELLKMGSKKIPIETAEPWIKLSMVEGIMFGAMFPDLTHKMLENQYERIDMNSYEEARKYGVALPERPPQMSVAEQEKSVLEIVKEYVDTYFPDLIQKLGLEEI